jgi:osmoprotectant transport system ATP-binding protein
MDGAARMIEIDDVHKAFGARKVIDGLSLTIDDGELFVLVGGSGSGKSTLLRMINRLLAPDTGRIRIDGVDVAGVPAETLRLGIGYAIQSVGLFPHWSVARNIATVPQLLGWPKARITARVEALMAMLQLDEPGLGDRLPSALSGGQQQRVGVARALAADPAIVLMDEPFGALDPLTRLALQDSLLRIQRDTRKTIVFVTHDMDEALRLGHRIALLDQGTVRQVGTPAELLGQPADDVVAHFVGGSNAALRLLGVVAVHEAVQAGYVDGAPSIDPEATLQDALARMLAERVDVLNVRREGGDSLGVVRLGGLVRSS